MADRFRPLSFLQLISWIVTELEAKGSIFGLPQELFYVPSGDRRLASSLYSQLLDTPIGVAAGPHSQLAANIVVAWLCGARLIELKTVQTLDRIEVKKPCIDMVDEGYNVEWSQELEVEQSFAEYLHAWVLVHLLHRRLGFAGTGPGVVFDMSLGYDLAGIRNANVQWFINQMRHAGNYLERCVETARHHMGETVGIEIPPQITRSVTLSTMHGCPPSQIGTIARYFMEELGLHTNVKLNPTLLGAKQLRQILNEALGFHRVRVPDGAFEHDPTFDEAVELIAGLRQVADRTGLHFGVKLGNTLEVENHRPVFGADHSTMYMSGRPLLAITGTLALRLAEVFDGRLPISYAGGADAFSVARLLAAGMTSVTTCSDILRPGGYTRLLQYSEQIEDALDASGADDLGQLAESTAAQRKGRQWVAALPEKDRQRLSALANLRDLATEALHDPTLQRKTFERCHTKTGRTLGSFDCIAAPCTEACAVNQQVSAYMRAVADRDLDRAANIVAADNPLPVILGRACDHRCQGPCVRSHYDEPLAIREVKRCITDNAPACTRLPQIDHTRPRTAIIGAGPCGLAVAWELRRAGFVATLFEAKDEPGGMVSATIPAYRAAPARVAAELTALATDGVEIRTGCAAGSGDLAGLRKQGFEHVVIATGAPRGLALGIDGEDSRGVVDGLDFLRAVKRSQAPQIDGTVGVIGGGDVAMDCARTARRLTSGEVLLIYRRTMAEMPARREELAGLLEEGISIVELTAPRRVVTTGERLCALECVRMELGPPDASGRARPVEVPGSEHRIALDALIVAIGQAPDLSPLEGHDLELTAAGYLAVDPVTMETSVPGIFAGGDIAGSGPASIVAACGDGKRIAAEIKRRAGLREEATPDAGPAPDRSQVVELLRQRSLRQRRVALPRLATEHCHTFAEELGTLTVAAAEAEARRCLSCDIMCSTCTTVCPNRALFTYRSVPRELAVPVIELVAGGWSVSSTLPFRLAQHLQVAVVADLCNECGNCVTFCPTQGRPFHDKPRIFLNRDDFEAETDNAFMVGSLGGTWSMSAILGGEQHRLTIHGSRLCYVSSRIEVDLTPGFEVKDVSPKPGAPLGGYSLVPGATMLMLSESLRISMPELPGV